MKPRTTLTLKSVLEFHHSDESYSRIGTLDQRINFKGSYCGYHMLMVNREKTVLSKESKLINYECRCIERGIKPFHYSQEEWKQVQNEIAGDEYADLQTDKFLASVGY